MTGDGTSRLGGLRRGANYDVQLQVDGDDRWTALDGDGAGGTGTGAGGDGAGGFTASDLTPLPPIHPTDDASLMIDARTWAPNQIIAAWRENPTTRGSIPYGWRLRYRQGDSPYTLLDYSANVKADILRALIPGRVYELQAQAVNAAGPSAWSSPATAATVTVGVPDTMTADLFKAVRKGRGTDIKCEWLPPFDNNSPLEEYELLEFEPRNHDEPYTKVCCLAGTQLYDFLDGTHKPNNVVQGYKYKIRARNGRRLGGVERVVPRHWVRGRGRSGRGRAGRREAAVQAVCVPDHEQRAEVRRRWEIRPCWLHFP